MRFGRILQLTVLNLQTKKPICKCRTVIVVGSYQTSLYHTVPYLVSLLFAPPILHTTNQFLDREVFDLLVPLIFFLCQECSVICCLVYSFQCLDSQGRIQGVGGCNPGALLSKILFFAHSFTRTAPRPPPPPPPAS